MKFVIPAKRSSSRLMDKNWREFHAGESLVEIKIAQLRKATLPENIYVSCDDETKRPLVESLGAQFIVRDTKYSADATHWCDVVTELVGSVPCSGDEDVAMVLATTPLFDDFANVIARWDSVRRDHDSLISVKRVQHYIVNDRGRPVNFSFGRWHEWSQHLPKWFFLEHAIHIMKKSRYLELSYYVGTNPYLYEVQGPSVDIDHPYEFEVAQELFKRNISQYHQPQ